MDSLKINIGEEANFWCPSKTQDITCAYCSTTGSLRAILEEDLRCPTTDVALKLVGRPVANCITGKLSLAAIQAERKLRSKADFNKNILPSFKKTSEEAVYFEKKKMLKNK